MKLSEKYDAIVGITTSGTTNITSEIAQLEAENERLTEAKEVIKVQAEDEGLWFLAKTAPEGYLQQELRRLHAIIEGDVLANPQEGMSLKEVKEKYLPNRDLDELRERNPNEYKRQTEGDFDALAEVDDEA